MKKTILKIFSALLFSTALNAADISFGVSGSILDVNGTGTETTRQSGEKNNGSASNSIGIGSVFVENNFGNFSLGLDYIPFKADVSDKVKTRTDSNASGDSGTYRAQAELKNHLTLYGLVPFGNNLFFKAGVAQVDVITKESATITASTYGDDTVYGGLIGLGVQKDNWRFAVEYTDYETISLTSNASNKIDANLDTTAFKLSYSF